MAMKIKYGGSMCDKSEEKVLINSIKKSIKTGQWQANEEADKMEKEASKFLGVRYGILTTSGSSAGLLALSALELSKGSEVIISACTFPTIFNIILQCDLIPVVVDAKIGTYNFDIDEVEKAITPMTRAIIAIHALGNPCDMRKLMDIARKNKIKVIEDNCDGWGSTLRGKKIGSYGDISITSFHAAHIVSMGVGGGVFTDDKELGEKVRIYRDWGRQANTNKSNTHKDLPSDYNPRFIYEKIGYNFQILELQAAMGRVQLKKADKIKSLRKKNFDYLFKHLSKYKDLVMPDSIKGADVCWFAFPISAPFGLRAHLVKHLEKNGIETRSMFAGNITKHPAYRNVNYRISGDLTHANYILRNSFWISVHPSLKQKDREYIVKVFNNFFR